MPTTVSKTLKPPIAMETHRLCVEHSWVHLLCTEPLVPRLVRTLEPAEDRYLQLHEFPRIILMLFVKACKWELLRSFLLKAHVAFMVLTLTTLYSYLEDRSEEVKKEEEKGYAKAMNVTSSGAFALMVLSLSRQLQLGFEVGVFNFLLGCFLVTLMKMNLKLAPVAAFFCYLLVNIRSLSDFVMEMRGNTGHDAGGGSDDSYNELSRAGQSDNRDTDSTRDVMEHYNSEEYSIV